MKTRTLGLFLLGMGCGPSLATESPDRPAERESAEPLEPVAARPGELDAASSIGSSRSARSPLDESEAASPHPTERDGDAPDVAARAIGRVGAARWRVQLSSLESMTREEAMGSFRFEPFERQGEVAIRLLEVVSGGLIDRLGFVEGDVVLTLNGSPPSVGNALEFYVQVRSPGTYRVGLDRSGEQREHVYEIVE